MVIVCGMHRNRKAKLVATLAPASATPDMICKPFEAGADVFRLNFSFGTHEEHRQWRDTICTLEAIPPAQSVGLMRGVAGAEDNAQPCIQIAGRLPVMRWHASMIQPKSRPVGRPGRDMQAHRATRRHDFDVGAKHKLRLRDRHIKPDILPLADKSQMRLHVDFNQRISNSTTEPVQQPAAMLAQNLPVRCSGRDIHVEPRAVGQNHSYRRAIHRIEEFCGEEGMLFRQRPRGHDFRRDRRAMAKWAGCRLVLLC